MVVDVRAELCDRGEREREAFTQREREREKADTEREEGCEMETVIFYQQNFEWFNVLY